MAVTISFETDCSPRLSAHGLAEQVGVWLQPTSGGCNSRSRVRMGAESFYEDRPRMRER